MQQDNRLIRKKKGGRVNYLTSSIRETVTISTEGGLGDVVDTVVVATERGLDITRLLDLGNGLLDITRLLVSSIKGLLVTNDGSDDSGFVVASVAAFLLAVDVHPNRVLGAFTEFRPSSASSISCGNSGVVGSTFFVSGAVDNGEDVFRGRRSFAFIRFDIGAFFALFLPFTVDASIDDSGGLTLRDVFASEGRFDSGTFVVIVVADIAARLHAVGSHPDGVIFTLGGTFIIDIGPFLAMVVGLSNTVLGFGRADGGVDDNYFNNADRAARFGAPWQHPSRVLGAFASVGPSGTAVVFIDAKCFVGGTV